MCYHYSAQVISRADGRSAVAAAAYRATEKMVDARTGETHDFSKKEHATFSQIMLPENAPADFANRQLLWDTVEATEKRKDAQLAREFNIALPSELKHEQQVALMQDFTQKAFVSKGMIADINLHSNVGNPHFHAMVTMRNVDESGFGQKNRDWNKKELLLEWRKLWADVANEHLVRNGHEARLDHRSLEAQGIDREPQIHHGGREIRVQRNEEIIQRNEILIDLRLSLPVVDTEIRLAMRDERLKATPAPTVAPNQLSYQESVYVFNEARKFLTDIKSKEPKKPYSITAEALAQDHLHHDVSDAERKLKDARVELKHKTELLENFYKDLPFFQKLMSSVGFRYDKKYYDLERKLMNGRKAAQEAIKAAQSDLKRIKAPEAHYSRLTRAQAYVRAQEAIAIEHQKWQKEFEDANLAMKRTEHQCSLALAREPKFHQQSQSQSKGFEPG